MPPVLSGRQGQGLSNTSWRAKPGQGTKRKCEAGTLRQGPCADRNMDIQKENTFRTKNTETRVATEERGNDMMGICKCIMRTSEA